MIVVGSGPKNATTDRSGLRTYTWQGRKLPSVTTVRRMAGIPHGLHQWSIGKVIDRAIDGLPEIFAKVSSGDPGQLALVRSMLRHAATEERDKAAKLGTAVHDAAASGRSLTEVEPEIAPRLRQYLDWRAVSRIEILATEFQVFNLTEGYGGTADLLGRFPDGSIWLIDLKTGKGLYGEHSLQLIAYLMAEFVGTDDVVDEDKTHLLHQASGLGVLHLGADGWEFRSMRADTETWTAFRGLLRFATWMHEHEAIDTVTVGARKGGSS